MADRIANIASVAVAVDAIDENARVFYRRYGFIDIPNRPNRLFITHEDGGAAFS